MLNVYWMLNFKLCTKQTWRFCNRTVGVVRLLFDLMPVNMNYLAQTGCKES